MERTGDEAFDAIEYVLSHSGATTTDWISSTTHTKYKLNVGVNDGHTIEDSFKLAGIQNLFVILKQKFGTCAKLLTLKNKKHFFFIKKSL